MIRFTLLINGIITYFASIFTPARLRQDEAVSSMKPVIITIITFVTVVISPVVRAIVDIENASISEHNPAFEARVNASISGKSGNSDTQKSSIGGRLQWADVDSINFIIFDAEKGESSGVLDSNKKFLHGRHIERVTDTYDYELFAQIESDEFTRLGSRWLVGGGLRASLLTSTAAHNMYLGLGVFASVEKLEELAGTTDAGKYRDIRANLYLLNDHRVTASTLIKNTLYYQPNLDSAEDYRLLEKFRLEVSINDALSVLLAFDISYDNEPPQGVEKRDFSYVTGLQYRFE